MVLKVLNEHLVLLVDGENRKMDNPKPKNIKHLSITRTTAETIKEALQKGDVPDNQAVKAVLKEIQTTRESHGKEV